VIAARNGWRGTISITGGALPAASRGQVVDRLERVMTQLCESLDEDVLSQLHIAPNIYPPDDLGELCKWRGLGAKSLVPPILVRDEMKRRPQEQGKAWMGSRESSASAGPLATLRDPSTRAGSSTRPLSR
jgi:hypothetical protein